MTAQEALKILVDNSNDLANSSYGMDAKIILDQTEEAEKVLHDKLEKTS